MAPSPDGTLYVNTWSGVYFKQNIPPDGGYQIALKDKDGSGHADIIQHSGETVAQGAHGGTGIAFYRDSIYVETNDRILRYALKPGEGGWRHVRRMSRVRRKRFARRRGPDNRAIGCGATAV
jgi:hypothetical protein